MSTRPRLQQAIDLIRQTGWTGAANDLQAMLGTPDMQELGIPRIVNQSDISYPFTPPGSNNILLPTYAVDPSLFYYLVATLIHEHYHDKFQRCQWGTAYYATVGAIANMNNFIPNWLVQFGAKEAWDIIERPAYTEELNFLNALLAQQKAAGADPRVLIEIQARRDSAQIQLSKVR